MDDSPEHKYLFTINTDASFSAEHKIGAYACWIKSTHYTIKESGMLTGRIGTSSVAEAKAVEHALWLVHQLVTDEPFLRKRKAIRLHFNTDSTWVIHALEGKMKRGKYLSVARHIEKLAKDYQITTRHVRAHVKMDGTARTYVNDWCDKNAKAHLRKRVSEINAKIRKTI